MNTPEGWMKVWESTVRSRPVRQALLGALLSALLGGCGPHDHPPDETPPDPAQDCTAIASTYEQLAAYESETQASTYAIALFTGGALPAVVLDLSALPASLNPSTCYWLTLWAEIGGYGGERVEVFDGPVQISDAASRRLVLPLDRPVEALRDASLRVVFELYEPARVTRSTGDFWLRDVIDAAPPAGATLSADCEGWTPLALPRLGQLVDGAFEPYSEARAAELLYGFQGSAMITPRLALPADVLADGACVEVTLANARADGSSVAGGFSSGVVLERVGDWLVSGALYNELLETQGVVGATLDVAVTLTAPGHRGVSRVAVPVVDAE